MPDLKEAAMIYHKHKYNIKTSMDNCHMHSINGITSKCIGIGFFHVHLYSTITNYSDHAHRLSGMTTFAIKTQNGHIHKLSNFVDIQLDHFHHYEGYTSEDISYVDEFAFEKPTT